MPLHYRYRLHGRGPALWPDHKPLPEVLQLQATTPEAIWHATYQGVPTAPGGATFKRAWFRHTRYDAADPRLPRLAIARWVSFDTAGTELEAEAAGAYTAATVAELMPDYRLITRRVWRDRIGFPQLPEEITRIAHDQNRDGKLRQVIVEDKATGTSALQTLRDSGPAWLRPMLEGFTPTTDKETRAGQAAVWCKNGCVLLPVPGPHVPWLEAFETELFDFPNAATKDQVDAFSQLVLWLEHYLAEGWHARGGVNQEHPAGPEYDVDLDADDLDELGYAGRGDE